MKQEAVCPAGMTGNIKPLSDNDAHDQLGPHRPTYNPVMLGLHWATATLLPAAYCTAWAFHSAFGPVNEPMFVMLHRSLGVTVMLTSLLRLVIRRRSRLPPLPSDLPVVQRIAARANAVGLYALMLIQPLLGLLASALHGDRIVLFGTFALPRLLPQDRTLAHALFQAHGIAGSLFMALVSLHAAAALYHHFVRKDHVLASMLPALRTTPGETGNAP